MVTPMQMACAITTVANHGVKVNPLLVKEIRDEDGHVVETFNAAEGQRVMRPETANHLIEALQAVVTDEGTAPMASHMRPSIEPGAGARCALRTYDGAMARVRSRSEAMTAGSALCIHDESIVPHVT